MTEHDVIGQLVGWHHNCYWDPTGVLAVPNTISVLPGRWESDLLVLQPSGLLYEIEVKVSVEDFHREFKTKAKKHEALVAGSVLFRRKRHQTRVSRFYFAMPRHVYDRVKNSIPEYAGVFVIEGPGLKPYKIKEARLLPTEKARDEERSAMLLCAYYKCWKRPK